MGSLVTTALPCTALCPDSSSAYCSKEHLHCQVWWLAVTGQLRACLDAVCACGFTTIKGRLPHGRLPRPLAAGHLLQRRTRALWPHAGHAAVLQLCRGCSLRTDSAWTDGAQDAENKRSDSRGSSACGHSACSGHRYAPNEQTALIEYEGLNTYLPSPGILVNAQLEYAPQPAPLKSASQHE